MEGKRRELKGIKSHLKNMKKSLKKKKKKISEVHGVQKRYFSNFKKIFSSFFFIIGQKALKFEILKYVVPITEDLNESHTRNDIRAAPAYHRRRRFFPSEVYRVHTVSKFRP